MIPIVVGTESDDPFAIDIGRYCGQVEDIADLISLKNFANSEFCPRFIGEAQKEPGAALTGRRVAIVSSASAWLSRDELAMRTLLVARAARDNGAESVVLIEPDLFYSAQDRGPRVDQGETDFERDLVDRRKFEGQPFSARLYAELLSLAGVDCVVTVHNHSTSVGVEFCERMPGGYYNLSPAPVIAHYVMDSDVVDTSDGGDRLVICAPDDGAMAYAQLMRKALKLPKLRLLLFEKERRDERTVISKVAPSSEIGLDELSGRDILIVDDMVRTGGTIVECCRKLRKSSPRRVVFGVTHFYSSEESRESLAKPDLDEIITTNSVPTILNRDTQGRLRKKMIVIKLERWIAAVVSRLGQENPTDLSTPPYSVDMSTKNPRWKRSHS